MTGAELLTAYAAGRRDFRGADFRRADMTGADFREADMTGADFREADLCFTYLRFTYLAGADFREADMTGADMTGADFREADMTGAGFREADMTGANLSRANLTGAVGLPAAPVVPNIDAAILAAIEGGGALDMDRWHTCATTHCRAGWAIHLAGAEGKALERKYGANVAGALIYAASRPGKRVPNWFATDKEALADLRACAARHDKP